MYFLWSREPLPPPPSAVSPAGPWFAWFATAVLLWRCRKRISRAISYTCLPLRLLKHQPKHQHHLRGGPPRLCVSRSAALQRQRPATARRDHHQLAVKRLSPKLIAAAIDEKQQQQQQQQQKRRCQQRQVTFKDPVSIGIESPMQLDNNTSNTCQSSFDLMDSSPPSSNTRYKNAAIAAATNPTTNHPPPASIMKSGRLNRKASMSSLKKQQQHNVTRASRKLTLKNSGGYGVHICQQAVFYRVTRSGRVYG